MGEDHTVLGKPLSRRSIEMCAQREAWEANPKKTIRTQGVVFGSSTRPMDTRQ